jgi:hypothetical protein
VPLQPAISVRNSALVITSRLTPSRTYWIVDELNRLPHVDHRDELRRELSRIFSQIPKRRIGASELNLLAPRGC